MPNDQYLRAAFEKVCREAIQAAGHYVSLMERAPFYGGPEEGGWWGEDVHVVAYQHFDTKEAAQAAAAQVIVLANELIEESRKSHGEQCLREMDWCDVRGLEADYLPEPDGPSTYYVEMTEQLPQGYRGNRQYF